MAKPIKQDFQVDLDPAVVSEAISIDPQALQSEYVRVPSDIGRYCGLYTDAFELYVVAKARLDDVDSDLRKEYRETPSPSGKITEGYIDACVMGDARYRSQRDELVAAEVLKSRVSGIIEAIRTKRDMLISLGADVRGERLPPPSLNERERRAGVR